MQLDLTLDELRQCDPEHFPECSAEVCGVRQIGSVRDLRERIARRRESCGPPNARPGPAAVYGDAQSLRKEVTESIRRQVDSGREIRQPPNIHLFVLEERQYLADAWIDGRPR